MAEKLQGVDVAAVPALLPDLAPSAVVEQLEEAADLVTETVRLRQAAWRSGILNTARSFWKFHHTPP